VSDKKNIDEHGRIFCDKYKVRVERNFVCDDCVRL
jgi:hypothetical protein